MKKIIFYFLSAIALIIPSSNIFAANSSCPSATQIKAAKLMLAFPDSFQAHHWYFASKAITHENIEWNIWLSLTFPNAKTEKEALNLAQDHLSKVILTANHPAPQAIPNNITVCDYVKSSDAYYLSALSPPQYD